MFLEVKDQLTIRNTVAVKTELANLDPTDTLTLDIAFSSDSDRDVAFELYSPANEWLGSTKTTISAGSAETSLSLTFNEELTPSKGYRLIASLRAVDGDWRTAVDTHTINNIEINSPYTPPVPEEGNLLGINAGVELGHLNDWKFSWDTQGTAEVVEEAAKDGQFGVKFDTTDGRVGILIDEDVLPEGLVKAGKTFTFSFYMKRVSGSGWAGGFTQLVNNNGGYKASSQAPWHGTAASPSDWILVEKDIAGEDWPDTGTLIQVNMQTQGSVWYADNFKLEDTTPVVVEPDNNILANVNPSFEEATVAPWAGYWENNETTNITLTTHAATDGQQSLHLTSDGNSNTGINLAPDVTPQDLGLGENQEYTISFDIKSNNGNTSGYFRNVVQGVWDSRVETWFAATTEWKTVTVTRTQQDWTNLDQQARLDLYLFANDGAGIDVYIDNIVIKPVTTP
ncbi:carbohydrate binding domain-containing protein [Paraglaciecola aquimarina]|uniref:Carbohydrate binding domain-containing protein n=1 Tax=Paraglaciecola aquimarina TaxID=1235557 RepID=A0ABU3T1Z2_9ALTE|nr:carbohydrate binding domain-containing protein [Paraglaciecola aquimarina]MDU0356286.1 carbohydrate binding domain-containing protein [Paraglaciecola aquimarina]